MNNILIEKLEEAAIYTLDVGDAGLFESAAAKIAELEEVVKAVAHIGVDFGYGKYELEARIIDDARTLMEQGK